MQSYSLHSISLEVSANANIVASHYSILFTAAKVIIMNNFKLVE